MREGTLPTPDELRAQEIERTNSVGHADSIEKILYQLATVAKHPIVYEAKSLRTGRPLKERRYAPPVNAVAVTPSLFRKFTCVPGCTACCQKFTLDYTPKEFIYATKHKEGFEAREVTVNGKTYEMCTNNQNENPICDFLRVEKPTGGLGCDQWPLPPLSCASAPQVQFIQMRPGVTYILKKPFGRAWAMTPTPQCTFEEVDDFEEYDIPGIIEIINRFQNWADHFEIETCLGEVSEFLVSCEEQSRRPTSATFVWAP